jgi:hypothetical protein
MKIKPRSRMNMTELYAEMERLESLSTSISLQRFMQLGKAIRLNIEPEELAKWLEDLELVDADVSSLRRFSQLAEELLANKSAASATKKLLSRAAKVSA